MTAAASTRTRTVVSIREPAGALEALEPAAPELVGERARGDAPDGYGLLRGVRRSSRPPLPHTQCVSPCRQREQLLLECCPPAPLGICLGLDTG
jgi:hypothetical protein